jgi:hypothetical protein
VHRQELLELTQELVADAREQLRCCAKQVGPPQQGLCVAVPSTRDSIHHAVQAD